MTADAGSALDVAGIAAVIAEHDWFTPRGYAWPCCPCGVEFPSNDESDCYVHVAEAVAAHVEALREADRAAAVDRALRKVERLLALPADHETTIVDPHLWAASVVRAARTEPTQ